MEIRKYDSCHRYGCLGSIYIIVIYKYIESWPPILSVYFESVTWDELTVGFENPPGGFDYANRSVLSYHFYIPPQVILLRYHFAPCTLHYFLSYNVVYRLQLISHLLRGKRILRGCIVQVYTCIELYSHLI